MRNGSLTQFLKVIFAVLLAVLVMLSPVFAQETQTTTLYPIDDAYVDLAATALNFGSAPQLELSWSSVQTAGGGNKLQIDRLAYLKFDLSISKDSIIRSAFLKLYVTNAVANSSIIVALRTKNTAWNETTITGKNAPDVPSSEKDARDRGIDEVEITKLKAWFSLNVTSYARSVGSGPLSLMVIGGNTKSPWSDVVQFHSKESQDESLRPSLEVTYYSAGGPDGGPRVVYLTMQSSHFGGSVYVNGTEYKFPENLEIVLDLPTGRDRIAASANISTTDRVTAIFQKWSDGSTENPREISLKNSLTLKALYVESYYLNITTQYGTTAGDGWYRHGSSATATVLGDLGTNPPAVRADGILGILGMSYVFDHWSGYPGDSSKLRIVLNGPVTVTAIWRRDYSLLYGNLIRAALSIGAGSVAALAVRWTVLSAQRPMAMRTERQRPGTKRRSAPTLSSTRPTKLVSAPAQTRTLVRPAPTKTLPPAGAAGSARVPPSARTVARTVPMQKTTKFCHQCGVKIPRESKYCEMCGKKQD